MNRKLKILHEKRKRHASSENGQAIVEFALALPLLLLIICGILDFGWIYTNQYKVEYAVYAGARYATIYGPDMTESALKTGIESITAENIPNGSAEYVNVTVNSGERTVRVKVSYPVRTITFVAGTIFGRYYTARAETAASY